MVTAGEKAVELLTADEGIAESPAGSNRTKYGKYWGVDGVAYCAMGVSWAYREAGSPLPSLQTSPTGKDGFIAYVPYMHGYATNNDERTDDPQVGDPVILFGQEHVGMFDGWIARGVSFNTIEANTASWNDSDGIYVARRVRYVTSVDCFWHPAANRELLPGEFQTFNKPTVKPQEDDDVIRVFQASNTKTVMVSGVTYRVIDRDWHDVIAGLLDLESKGIVAPIARNEQGWLLIPAISDSALALFKEV